MKDISLWFLLGLLLLLVLIVFFLGGTMEETKEGDIVRDTLKRFERRMRNRGFNISKFLMYGKYIIAVDDEKKLWTINIPNEPIFKYSQLLDFNILEDGHKVVQGRSGSALVGGLLFGATGAAVGASRKKDVKEYSTLEIHIMVNDLNYNNLPLYIGAKNSYSQKFAQDTAALFTYILNNQE